MKRAIIALSLISFIFCSSESCSEEEDYSNCSTHEVDYENFSCYKINYGDSQQCSEFPDNSDSQKAIFKIINFMEKEISSGYTGFYNNDNFEEDLFLDYYTEKESYQKGQEIIIKSKRMSDDNISIFNSKKTCAYQLFGEFMKNLVNFQEGTEDFKGYVNVEDKNSCFNAQQFPDLKDIIGCGYAEIKYINEENKEYNIKSCFYVPTNKMPEDLNSYLRDYYLYELFDEIIPLIFSTFENNENNKIEDSERRLEATTPSIEIVAEDKNGKKVKYTSGSNDIEVIEKGKEDEEGKKGRRRSASNIYNISKLNIILFICLILFSF